MTFYFEQHHYKSQPLYLPYDEVFVHMVITLKDGWILFSGTKSVSYTDAHIYIYIDSAWSDNREKAYWARSWNGVEQLVTSPHTMLLGNDVVHCPYTKMCGTLLMYLQGTKLVNSNQPASWLEDNEESSVVKYKVKATVYSFITNKNKYCSSLFMFHYLWYIVIGWLKCLVFCNNVVKVKRHFLHKSCMFIRKPLCFPQF